MFQSDYFLKKHGIVLDTSKSVEEQILKMTVGFGVQESVSDARPYIFISYAHKDSAVVLPAIKALQDKGYPVWYDAGIRPGTTWSDYIADHVRNAALVIAFMSKNAIASPHCQSEIRYAFNNRRPILTVMLDQSRLPPGLDMQLSQWQMFSAHLYDGDTYLIKFAEDGFVASTVGAELNAYNQELQRKEEEAEKRRKEAEEAERKRKEAEAERKRREAEEAERRRREAEKAERERKEMEAEEHVRKIFEAAELRRQKREGIERKRKELEAAERKRREVVDAEIRRLKEEQAELELQSETMKQQYLDQIEKDRKLEEVKAALEKEHGLRVTAEKSLSVAQARIAELECATTVRLGTNKMDSKEIAAKEKLAQYYRKVQDLLSEQTYSGYYDAISTYNNEMCAVAKCFPVLGSELLEYRERIHTILHHDACTFEKKRKLRLAHALYDAQSDYSLTAKKQRETIAKQAGDRIFNKTMPVFSLYLVVYFLLVFFVYDPEASFWFSTMVSFGPMIVLCALWLICNATWLDSCFNEDVWCPFALGAVGASLIALVACPFLYPEMGVWPSILTSVVYNAGSGLIGFFGAGFTGELFSSSERHHILHLKGGDQ